MKCLQRNLKAFQFCPFVSMSRNGTSVSITYGEPITAKGNISPASGRVASEIFGAELDYDKVIILDDQTLSIDEHSVLFVDKPYEVDDETGAPLYDYVVKRIAKSLNFTAIAIHRVDVT